ncbi:pseudouridylate synthase TRUB2, mitochondrial-like [Babylonia areolata]|uniref:pseudouridylate synthase TRUB2, mitochondrial-like n=1 Tax=Babylonia areolata TaxID=304850 RepID=UPI003FD0B3C0
MKMPQFTWAPAVYRQLNGLLCVYKPAGLPVMEMLERIKFSLARDLNELPCYKVESQMRKKDPAADLGMPMVLDTSSPALTEDMLEHRLVLGQRYIPSDFNLKHIHGLRRHSSGVLLVGVGKYRDSLDLLAMSRYLRVYHVKGRFGWATNNFSPKGKIIERTSYRHVTPIKLDKVVASIQSSHLRNTFHYAGVDPHSQAAYRLASEGLVRPVDGHTPPMLYSVKCVHFQLPDFTLEIHSINEQCDYFQHMVHDIGLQLKSTAVCTGVRRLRYGHFTVDHALLRQQWTLRDILDNLQHSAGMLSPHLLAAEDTVQKVGSGLESENHEGKLIEG